MKTTVEKETPRPVKDLFPCVREWHSSGEVVLFTSPTKGIVLKQGTASFSHLVGYTSPTFISYDSDDWKPCSITLDSLED